MRTASALSTGREPGRPRQTGQTFELGRAPNEVEQAQNALVLVRSWACTSRPMTGSNSVSMGSVPRLFAIDAGVRRVARFVARIFGQPRSIAALFGHQQILA